MIPIILLGESSKLELTEPWLFKLLKEELDLLTPGSLKEELDLLTPGSLKEELDLLTAGSLKLNRCWLGYITSCI